MMRTYLCSRCYPSDVSVSRLVLRFLEIRFDIDLFQAPVRSEPAFVKVRVEVRLVAGKFVALKAEINAFLFVA